jgi:energy-coupling factor transport system permease protein
MPLIHIPFGNYIFGTTPVHRLDPRVKMLAVATLLPAILLVGHWRGLLPVAVVTLAAILAARISPRALAGDVWSLRLFYLITILAHALFDRSGHILIRLPYNIHITDIGLNRGALFTVKIIILTLFAGVLHRTTHPADWERAMESLLPSRSRLGRLIGRPALTFGLALRMLPLLLNEAFRIRLAQIGRGLEFQGSLIKRVRSLEPLVGPLLSASLHRADSLTAAMHSRGYRLDAPRSSYHKLYFGWLGAVGSITVIIATITAILWK